MPKRTPATPSVPKSDTARYAGLSVLLLEDSPHFAGLVCGILKSFGIGTIHSARDGEDALFILANHRVHLAVVDDLRPPLDGLTVVRTIRTAAAQLPNELPIIFVTETPSKSTVIAARDSGVTEVLSKPFSAAQLMARIASVIRKPRPLVRTEGFVGPDRRRRTKDTATKRREMDRIPTISS